MAGVRRPAYTYLANSLLVQQISFTQGTTPRMTTTQAHDQLNRLTSISSAPSSSSSSSSAYQYNAANQRTRATLAEGGYWLYVYDALGQVKRGARFFSDGHPVPGQQFEYRFDDIGNRKGTQASGDQDGANLRPASYTANLQNQYTSRTVPGGFDVIGLARGDNSTLAVNGSAPWRKGGVFPAGSDGGQQQRGGVAELRPGLSPADRRRRLRPLQSVSLSIRVGPAAPG